MGLKRSIAAVALLFVAAGATARPLTWARTYGEEHGLLPWVGELPDGGFIAAGTINVPPPIYCAAWVVRLDMAGNVVWQKTFDAQISSLWCGTVTSDGGFVLAGESHLDAPSYVSSAWIMKFDAEGNVQWDRSFGAQGRHLIQAVRQVKDGGLVFAGTLQPGDAPPAYAWVFKLDRSGNRTWSRRYHGGVWESLAALDETSDAGLVVAGYTTSYGGTKALVVRLDQNGQVVWQRAWGGQIGEEFSAIREVAGGGFMVAGMTNTFTSWPRSLWLVKLDSSGVLEWQRAFDAWSDGQAVTPRRDGSVLVLAREPRGFWLLQMATSGVLAWQRAIGPTYGHYPGAASELADGGLVASGSWYWGTSEERGWVLRLDADGQLDAPCALAIDVATTSTATDATAVETTLTTVDDFPPEVPSGTVPVTVASATHPQCGACAIGEGGPPEPSARGTRVPLRVSRRPERLHFERVSQATAYDVHVDHVGSWYTPSAATGTQCTVTAWTDDGNGGLVIDQTLPPNSWVVVSASNACGRSSSGQDSLGRERRARGTWEPCPLGP